MAVHLRTAFGHLPFLLLQLLGLLRQPGRRGCDLTGLLLYLRLSPLQLRRAVQQRLLHLADAALPLDQLLPEGGDRQPMLVAGHVQGQFLLAHALDLRLDVLPGGLQVVAALAGVAVDLGQMLAQLLARRSSRSMPTAARVSRSGSPRISSSASVRAVSNSRRVRSAASFGRLPLHLEGDAFRGQRLPLAVQRVPRLLQMVGFRPLRFLIAGQVAGQRVQFGGAVGQLLAETLQLRRLLLAFLLGGLRLLLQSGRLLAQTRVSCSDCCFCRSFNSSERRRNCSCSAVSVCSALDKAVSRSRCVSRSADSRLCSSSSWAARR